jgi:hypothetical protein
MGKTLMSHRVGRESILWPVITALMAGVATMAALLTVWPAMAICSIGGWLLAAAAVALTARVWSRHRREMRPESSVPGCHVAVVCTITIVLLLASTCVNMMMLGAMRRSGKTAIALANLVAIRTSLECYHDEHEMYPETLDDLVAVGLVSHKQLINPFDPDRPRPLPERPTGYKSFVYTPLHVALPDRSKLIIAYETSAITPTEARIFTPYGRWVLFADGRVEAVAEKDFQAELVRDRELRRHSESNTPSAQSDTMPSK